MSRFGTRAMHAVSLLDADKRITSLARALLAGLVCAMVALMAWRALPSTGPTQVETDDASALHTVDKSNHNFLWIAAAVVLAGASAWVGYAAGGRRRESESAKHRHDVLASLARVSSRLTDKPEAIDAALDQLLRDVPDIIGLPVATLQSSVQGERNLDVTHAAGVPQLVGHEFPIVARSDADSDSHWRDVLTIEDTESADPTHVPAHLKAAGVRAAMVFPLGVESESLGVLTLGDTRPRRFNRAQREFGRLWSTLASLLLAHQSSHGRLVGINARHEASAVENARLHAQASRDAETKATLLRELHHRVKNNLAAIVGLLSTNVPAMSPAAQRWLDRLTERISSMAQAQELFNRSTTEVSLAEIVQRVVTSISAVAPQGVTIVTRLGEVPVRLEADRAVALTMALHELCHNALTYGVGQRGTVTLGARMIDARRLRIEVIDDGSAAPADRSAGDEGTPGNGSPVTQVSPMGVGRAKLGGKAGLGIHVVRGLVARELRGEFALLSPAHGGTIATIEFPIVDAPSEVRL